jgi:hypothetical protein
MDSDDVDRSSHCVAFVIAASAQRSKAMTAARRWHLDPEDVMFVPVTRRSAWWGLTVQRFGLRNDQWYQIKDLLPGGRQQWE